MMLVHKISTSDEALGGDHLVIHHDHIVVLHNATWSDYQRVLEIRGDRSVPRLAYLKGELELMTPSRRHETLKSVIGCLVEVWCQERGIEFSPYGSWTLENKDSDRGVEPDECYVFGEVSDPERPDLAIEVIWTSGGLDKREIYRALGVRELWFWRKGQLTAYALGPAGYEAIASSAVLPGIDLAQLASFLDHSPVSKAMREYRAVLQSKK
jgi:Uma2 family endonuclease